MKSRDKVSSYLIFDDPLGRISFRSAICEKMAGASRHHSLSIFILTQQYHKLSQPIRNNASYLFCFKTEYLDHILQIYEENNCFANKLEFVKQYRKFTLGRFCCMLIDKTDETTKISQYKADKFKFKGCYHFVKPKEKIQVKKKIEYRKFVQNKFILNKRKRLF